MSTQTDTNADTISNAETKPNNHTGPVDDSKISKTEIGVTLLIFLALLVLRWFYTSTRGWDSDEPQHLHVVWGWLNGLLPYRDLFDNHMPLFQVLSVPLFASLGERPDIVTAMRWGVVPLMALGIVAIYFIGSRLFSRRIGLWGAVIAAAFPPVYFKMRISSGCFMGSHLAGHPCSDKRRQLTTEEVVLCGISVRYCVLRFDEDNVPVADISSGRCGHVVFFDSRARKLCLTSHRPLRALLSQCAAC
jgi:hypothetical protein